MNKLLSSKCIFFNIHCIFSFFFPLNMWLSHKAKSWRWVSECSVTSVSAGFSAPETPPGSPPSPGKAALVSVVPPLMERSQQSRLPKSHPMAPVFTCRWDTWVSQNGDGAGSETGPLGCWGTVTRHSFAFVFSFTEPHLSDSVCRFPFLLGAIERAQDLGSPLFHFNKRPRHEENVRSFFHLYAFLKFRLGCFRSSLGGDESLV